MTDIVVAAWITVGGTVLVAVVSVVTQFLGTRFVIKAEHSKIARQVHAEHRSRVIERRAVLLMEALAELLSETDPQVKATFDYGRVVSLIHRAQLSLDRSRSGEAQLNNALNQLGFELQKYIPNHSKPVQERLVELKLLLGAHAAVAKLGAELLHHSEETL